MNNILEFNAYVNEIMVDENPLDEAYIDEAFSSEFFNYDDYITEKKVYDDSILMEYRRIKPFLKEGKQWKNITRRYFELETEFMEKALNKDKEYVRNTVTSIKENLTLLNEDSDDYTLNEQRNNKIKLLESYKRKQIRKINKELKEMVDFYQTNPKILIT